MKKLASLFLSLVLLVSLCACSEKKTDTTTTDATTADMTTMDVTIEGGADSAAEAVQKYYEAMPALNYEDMILVSASLNKSCVQNTVANYNEEKYNTGIETMKTELAKDMANVSITVAVGETTEYDATSETYKTFVKEYKVVCIGLDKAQCMAKVKVTLTFKESENEFTEDIEQNCIKIQDRWFVFDYSEETTQTDTTAPTESTEPVHVDIVGGGTSIEDVTKKYFKAISDKNATDLANVLVTMNKTAMEAICGGVNDEEYQKGFDAMKAELAADTDTAVLTPTVSESKTYQPGSNEFTTFLSTHSTLLIITDQIKEYADVSVSLSITVPGETETFSATEKITCIRIDDAWFVMVTE